MTAMIAFGAGVNSTAMLIQLVASRITIDAVIFADTGCEWPETHAHLALVTEWLKAHNGPPLTIVKPTETLEEYCLRRRCLPSFAYGRRSCTDNFKFRPLHRWVRAWIATRGSLKQKEKIILYVGIGLDEALRRRRIQAAIPKRYELRFPLIRNGIIRDEAAQICAGEGWTVQKSSCWCCPAMKKWEVKKLAREHPELMLRALRIENQARLHTIKGLGRRWNWSEYLQEEHCYPIEVEGSAGNVNHYVVSRAGES